MMKAGATGEALIEFIISPRGDVVEAHVVSATNSLFGEAAVAAVLRCKYKPGIKNGVAIATRMQMPLYFTLE